MGQIRLLPDDVASQVAAGEVVERPASVLKELVENSLDAGASRIDVRFRRGGSSLIEVADNGCGMDREDALLCLERHATSKLRSGTDLASIATLGFRGEALPSIASVSRFRLATRQSGALDGTEIAVAGGRIDFVRACGCAPGTVIEVRNLFFNLPARRKFLRTEQTEQSHLETTFRLLALSHPNIRFTLSREDRVMHQLAPTTLLERIRDLFGPELARRLIAVPDSGDAPFRVYGYLGEPGLSRSDRSQQLVFVNGRAVENAVLSRALREGYHTALMRGQHPITFLFIEMDPGMVDVNVHPAKREVRFRDGRGLHEGVVRMVQEALQSHRGPWTRRFALEARHQGNDVPLAAHPSPATMSTRGQPLLALSTESENVSPSRDPLPQPLIRYTKQHALPSEGSPSGDHQESGDDQVGDDQVSGDLSLQQPGTGADDPALTSKLEASLFKILGVLGKTYLVLENRQGLVMVDQHAAHERILFEQLRKRMEYQGALSQQLLLAQTIQLAPKDSDWVMKNLDTLEQMGIGLEPFGPSTFKLEALPAYLKASDPQRLMLDIIGELAQKSITTSRLRLGEDVIAKTVCRHAVKARDSLGPAECQRLLEDLLACDLPYCCPHGRPTMIQISYDELEKKFGRQAPSWGAL